MDLTDSKTSFQAPVMGFRLLHYQNQHFSHNAPVVVNLVGIFTSLTHAQEAARHALERTVSKHHREGYSGRYCTDIYSNLQGQVTVYGYIMVDECWVTEEFWLSEFHLETIGVLDVSWDAEVRRSSENALFYSPSSEVCNKMQITKKPKPVVRLPVETRPVPTYIAKLKSARQPPTTGVRYPEEQQETWSSSRPPLPMSDSQPLPQATTQTTRYEEEHQLEWSRTRPS